jgi:hypothetical protein
MPDEPGLMYSTRREFTGELACAFGLTEQPATLEELACAFSTTEPSTAASRTTLLVMLSAALRL